MKKIILHLPHIDLSTFVKLIKIDQILLKVICKRLSGGNPIETLLHADYINPRVLKFNKKYLKMCME